jgi:phosphoglycerol transferase
MILDAVFKKVAGSSFNDAILFHLRYGLEGAGLGDFKIDIIKFSCVILLGLGLILFFALKTRRPTRSRSKDFTLLFTAAAVGGLAVVTNPFTIAAWAVLNPIQTETYVDFYIKPEITKIPDRKPNLVWIYAESLERTYMDESLFPGLTPGLKELESSSLSFTNVEQVDSTGWTIAGMVATQCGIPLTSTGGNGNSMAGVNYFLPGAICLGDLLKSAGYNSVYMGGADLNFAGKGKFYQTHGFTEIIGRAQLENKLSDPSYVNYWGLFDDSLFEFLKQKHISLMKSEIKPFSLVSLTVNTHQPDGHVSRKCSQLKYRSGKNPMLNAVHCSDLLITQLVQDIRTLDKENNTFIVISSDHLAMPNTASDKLNRGNRRNLFIVNSPGSAQPRRIDRRATQFDFAPTILEIMGFTNRGVGLGRNILGDSPLLTEAYPDYGNKLRSWLGAFSKAWQLPKGVKEIVIRPKTRQIILGTSSFSAPVLISLDRNKDVTSLVFPESEDATTLISRVEPRDNRESKVLVESCGQFKAKFQGLALPDDSLCFFNTAVGKPIEVKKAVSFDI